MGALLAFAPGRASDAYANIAAIEPEHQYRWAVADVETKTATRKANVLVGKSPRKGSAPLDDPEWDGRRDPLFTTALDVVGEALATNQTFAWDMKPLFRLQMAYLLLWSAIALVDAFVACAERIKDTDASCIALAGVQGIPLVTDDRKERRIALELFPRIELISTLDLVHDAAVILGWKDDALVKVAAALRWRGNFAPPLQDVRRDWYLSLLERAGIPVP